MTKKQKKAIKRILKGIKELGWDIAVPTKDKKLEGMIIGTDKYINETQNKLNIIQHNKLITK